VAGGKNEAGKKIAEYNTDYTSLCEIDKYIQPLLLYLYRKSGQIIADIASILNAMYG
jgi:hypothetical protein